MYGHTVGYVGRFCDLGLLYVMAVFHLMPAMDMQFRMSPDIGIDCLVGYILSRGLKMCRNLLGRPLPLRQQGYGFLHHGLWNQAV